MSISFIVSKKANISDLKNIFDGEIPDYHPEEYIQSRVDSQYIFVAKEKDIPIGFLIYSFWWGNCPFIELIKVKKEFQKQGVGKALLGHFKQEMKSKNFTQIISSTEAINQDGYQFHVKTGFNKLSSLLLPHGEEVFFKLSL